MNIEKALKFAEEEFRKSKIASFQLDAQLLIAHALNQSREFLIANPDYVLDSSETTKLKQYVSRRTDREPVCYITNKIEFYGHNFYVDKRVLSPRAETETIVQNAIEHAPKNSKLIDIGTGSGAIAISIAIARPDLEITATEVSKEALEVAKINAKDLMGKNNIKFVYSNLFSKVTGKYETVVTNLPYVSSDSMDKMKPEVKKEPAIALYGGRGDGLDLYREFYEQLPDHIISVSRVYHESDPWQHNALIKLAKNADLSPVLEDYFILGFKKI